MTFQLLGAACGLGAQIHGTAQGPAAFCQSDILKQWQDKGLTIEDFELLTTAGDRPEDFFDFLSRWYELVQHTIVQHKKPLIIGGDHAIAASTWRAVADAHQARGRLGLIWMDAHLDAHTLQTSPSKAYHGMPASALLGHHEQAWGPGYDLPVLLPQNVVYIGVRSYEPEELALLKSLGVTIYFAEQVEKNGFEAVFLEAVEQLKGCDYLGLTLDCDAFCPEDLPGVGSPEPYGLHLPTVLDVFARHPQPWCAIEMTEYNPDLDQGNKTQRAIHALIESLIHRGQHG